MGMSSRLRKLESTSVSSTMSREDSPFTESPPRRPCTSCARSGRPRLVPMEFHTCTPVTEEPSDTLIPSSRGMTPSRSTSPLARSLTPSCPVRDILVASTLSTSRTPRDTPSLPELAMSSSLARAARPTFLCQRARESSSPSQRKETRDLESRETKYCHFHCCGYNASINYNYVDQKKKST